MFADWDRVENELRTLLANHREPSGLHDWALVEAAHTEGVIGDATVNNLQGTHVLLRLAAHESNRVTAKRAQEFTDLVDAVLCSMRNPPAA